jgi:hypothetical protein
VTGKIIFFLHDPLRERRGLAHRSVSTRAFLNMAAAYSGAGIITRFGELVEYCAQPESVPQAVKA